MKVTFRLILSVVAVITLVVTAFTYWQVRQERRVLADDMTRRAALLAESFQETLESLLLNPKSDRLGRLVAKFGDRERLAGIALYDIEGKALAITPSLAPFLSESPIPLQKTIDSGEPVAQFQNANNRPFHMFILPLRAENGTQGAVAIIQRASHIQEKVRNIWKHGFLRLLIQSLLISLVTLLIIRWNIMGPIARAADWIKDLRLGQETAHHAPLPKDLFGPLEKEMTHMASSLSAARAAAEEEAKLRHNAESLWTAERLKEHVKTQLQDKPLFVISNREPYMHVRHGKNVAAIVPASGLVTALEPVLKACGGTWIAHGAGDADKDTVDQCDQVRVPPEDPVYSLRRVWLSREEENGYYYGFSNEGLWPLCHIAHTRPLFRSEDWKQYQAVNAKFAEVALEEMKDTKEPCVFIQDYHFALLPGLIKQERPDARVAVFWHIPWPNPESFSICPWQREILQGLLGADLLGFHVQFHCNNFLETVDRALESRIDWERFTVNRERHTTIVRPFPISVAINRPPTSAGEAPPLIDKETLLKELGIKAEFLAVGVDRIDYTKGIIERFRAVEHFLEKYPDYQGKFTCVELGAPSRTLIKRYHDLVAEIDAEVDRINWRFKGKDWKPIVFLKKHHSHREIEPFYKAADVCLVTALHDGMNLVAKEFVSAREDGDGVLILSQFTGASRELRDSLIVNPYDSERVAEAIRFALTMEPEERRARMARLRGVVQDQNIFRWGANLITELSQIRIEQEKASPV